MCLWMSERERNNYISFYNFFKVFFYDDFSAAFLYFFLCFNSHSVYSSVCLSSSAASVVVTE